MNMRRIHARLPVYRVEAAGRTLLYAPGRALELKAADADALQRSFESGGFAMAGDLSLAAAVLKDAAQAALRERQAQLDAPIAPLCLTVLVSNRCNLACTYCYSALEREPRRRTIGIPIVSRAAREVVDVNLVERAAHVVAGHCARAERPLTVVFHGGGEPTLQGERLPQLVACTQRAAIDAGIRWWGYIATNGAMSERRAQWLASTFDRIGLSCDGTPALHDQQRPTRSGRGSWLQVCRTGQALRRAGADFDLRVTVTRNGIEPLPATVRHLFEAFGARLLRVEPVYSSDGSTAPTLDADDAAAFVEAFLSVREWARANGGDVELSGTRPREIHGPYCNPLRDVLQITPDGIASACFASSSRAVAERRGHVVGTLLLGTDAIVWDRSAIERGRRNALALASRCDECVNAMHCVRDCPTVCHFQPQGAHAKQDDSFRCRVWKACSIDWMLRHAVSVEALSSPVPASGNPGKPS
jgi:sulfatase maturation enzyme AslB (radical SAM superfamily)